MSAAGTNLIWENDGYNFYTLGTYDGSAHFGTPSSMTDLAVVALNAVTNLYCRACGLKGHTIGTCSTYRYFNYLLSTIDKNWEEDTMAFRSWLMSREHHVMGDEDKSGV